MVSCADLSFGYYCKYEYYMEVPAACPQHEPIKQGSVQSAMLPMHSECIGSMALWTLHCWIGSCGGSMQ